MSESTAAILFVLCLIAMILAAGLGGFLFGVQYGMRKRPHYQTVNLSVHEVSKNFAETARQVRDTIGPKRL